MWDERDVNTVHSRCLKYRKKMPSQAHSDLGGCIRCLSPRMNPYSIIIIVIISIILLSPVAAGITYRKNAR